jgi:hypothetical protein
VLFARTEGRAVRTKRRRTCCSHEAPKDVLFARSV